MGRRDFLKNSLVTSAAVATGATALMTFPRDASAAPIPAFNGFGGIGFDSIPPSLAPVLDAVTVPAGYKVELMVAWGDPIMPGAPAWAEDATQTAADQAKQYGMHNDGMHFFPFSSRTGLTSDRGVMCVNNEYTHEDILHGSEGLLGGSGVTIAKVRKSQAAHGVSIFEVRRTAGKWGVVKSSAYGRRITANTPMAVSGPAAGHALLKSKQFDIQPTGSTEIGVNDGFTAYGTINNCAHGYTPWGTYLTCEENWNGNFGWNAADSSIVLPAEVATLQTRYGLAAAGFAYNWHVMDPRLNARTNPLEPHLFGWVVEIDPYDPNSVPVKRTALGRFKHEGAWHAVSADANGTPNRVALYMGDDERNEYIYKFVAAAPFNPANRMANRNLLDTGTLYVARFTSTPVAGKSETYRGEWVALTPGTLGTNGVALRDNPNFAGADDAEVLAKILIKTRQAGDAVGATMMDRPEWTAVRTYSGYGYGNYSAERPLEIFCTLTNNSRRGNTPVSVNNPNGSSGAATANPPVDLANPRPDNDFGHIIRWREDGNHVTATGFEWDIFTLNGDTLTAKTLAGSYTNTNLVGGVAGVGPAYQGNINDSPNGSADFGAPDGLWFDQFGRLWIQTDQAGDAAGDFANVGANVMCCADPNTKEIRRFLTSPRNCEVTGVVNTPDGKAMFVGIQHPGENGTAGNPTQFSNWPQGQFATNAAGEALPNGANHRPRSSMLVITRLDGGVIGA
jgi:secreted PhoX family phosphatase